MNIHLLIIDAQKDFCDKRGNLFVEGADEDMKRLSAFVSSKIKEISQIHVTMDSHRLVDVAHPIFWVNEKSEHPKPFTIISAEDVEKGVWATTHPSWKDIGISYVKELDKNGRYPLCIWPPHCLIGTWGHSIDELVMDSLLEWQAKRLGIVNFISKGSNIFTEHYSAIKADVIDASDPSTEINRDLIEVLKGADEILVGGEALSHCVANTVTDLADNLGEDNIKKIVLLKDTCSNVTGFEYLGIDFIEKMTARGMRVTTSDKY